MTQNDLKMITQVPGSVSFEIELKASFVLLNNLSNYIDISKKLHSDL